MLERTPKVGDTVWYWGSEGGRLLAQAAMVTALSSDEPRTHVRVHLFAEVGYAGEARLWAYYSPLPAEGRWSFRPD